MGGKLLQAVKTYREMIMIGSKQSIYLEVTVVNGEVQKYQPAVESELEFKKLPGTVKQQIHFRIHNTDWDPVKYEQRILDTHPMLDNKPINISA